MLRRRAMRKLWWHCLPALAALLLPLAPVSEAAKPRPQRTLPYQPWREGLPSARAYCGMATAVDGSVWMFGGRISDAKYSDELLKLDPHERRWHAVTTPRPSPSARAVHSMVALSGNRVLVFGGVSGTFGVSDELWALDVPAPKWTLLDATSSGAPGRPSARYGHSMVALSGNRVLVFGGQGSGGSFDNELWALDVPAAEWTLLDAASSGAPGQARPSARGGHSMVALSGNRVLVFGGYTTSGKSDELWSLDVPTTEWTLLDAANSGAPSARYGNSMIALSGTRVLVFGGVASVVDRWGDDVSDELWALDVPTTEWTLLDAASSGAPERARPSARYGNSMVALNGTRVLVFGGVELDDDMSDELWALDVPTTEWTLLDTAATGAPGPRPRARQFHGMVALSGTHMLVFGGFAVSVYSDELWALRVAADDSAVGWTLLNSVNVTADELREQFNRAQVCASPTNACTSWSPLHRTH